MKIKFFTIKKRIKLDLIYTIINNYRLLKSTAKIRNVIIKNISTFDIGMFLSLTINPMKGICGNGI